MGTALDRATELSDTITTKATEENVTLPSYRLIQAGDPVIATCGVVCAATLVQPLLNFDPTVMARCAPPQRVTVVGSIARDYVTVDAEGIDIPERVADASALMMADADLLWDAAFSVDPYLGPEQVSVQWVITGALAITSVQYVIGVM